MENLDSLSELKNDLKELEQILSTVIRSNVRQIIAQSVSTLKCKVEALEEEKKKKTKSQTTNNSENQNEEKPATKQLYTTKITTYGWDESDKFVKIYVSLKNIEQVRADQLICDCTEKSFKLTISNHCERNHVLQIMNLAQNIKPSESSCKVKAGNVLVLLRKDIVGKTWGTLTEAQRKEKEAKDNKMSDTSGMDTSDPSGGIMNLMKKMYDDGDDDMKRMIKKTWYETQQKQGTPGEMPSFT